MEISNQNKSGLYSSIMRGSTAGLADGIIATPKGVHATFLTFLDIIFSSVIVAPLTIAYWRGTWNLMGYVLFPNDIFLSAHASNAIGIIGHFVTTIYQEKFNKSFHPDKHRITFLLFSRLYTMVYGIICVNHWRGGWLLLDQYVPLVISIVASITIVSALLLAFCKGLRNISSSPFAIATDHSKDYFVVPTMFKASVREIFLEEKCRFILCPFGLILLDKIEL